MAEARCEDGDIVVASGLDWGDGPGRHIVFAKWSDYCWVDVRDEATELRYLTHWLNIHELPAPDAQGGQP
jgi:hypothetical protein